MLGSSIRIKSALLLLLVLPFAGMAQVSLNDTIQLENVTIRRTAQVRGNVSGLKAVRLDSLALVSKTSQSFAEMLQENTPIFIKTASRGSVATASFRGTAASHTQVFWNGLLLNSPLTGQVDFSIIPVFIVDDVSLHFGQASLALGSGGLGGAVNMSSRPEWDKKRSLSLYQSVGSFGSYTTALSAGYQVAKGLMLRTRVYNDVADNDYTYKNIASLEDTLVTQRNADYTKRGVFQELYYRPNSSHTLSAKFWYQDFDRGIPKLMLTMSQVEQSRQNDINLNGVVEWSYFGSGLTSRVTAGYSHQSIDYFLNKQGEEGWNQIVDAYSQTYMYSLNGEVGVKVNRWASINIAANVLYSGINSKELILQNRLDINRTQYSSYLNFTLTPVERLSVNVTSRFDAIPSEGSYTLLPSVAAQYRLLSHQNLHINASVGRNHHEPKLTDKYWLPGGNPDLKPEDGLMMEGGVEYEKSMGETFLKIGVNAFRSDIQDWIMWLPHLKGYWVAQNVDRVISKGLETNALISFPLGAFTLKTKLAYSYTPTGFVEVGRLISQESVGKQLPFIPKHSTSVVSMVKYKSFYFMHNFTHYSRRYTTASNNPDVSRPLAVYFMNSLTVGYQFVAFKSNFSIQAKVDNLLNESYVSVLWSGMPGRNYMLTVKVEI